MFKKFLDKFRPAAPNPTEIPPPDQTEWERVLRRLQARTCTYVAVGAKHNVTVGYVPADVPRADIRQAMEDGGLIPVAAPQFPLNGYSNGTLLVSHLGSPVFPANGEFLHLRTEETVLTEIPIELSEEHREIFLDFVSEVYSSDEYRQYCKGDAPLALELPAVLAVYPPAILTDRFHLLSVLFKQFERVDDLKTLVIFATIPPALLDDLLLAIRRQSNYIDLEIKLIVGNGYWRYQLGDY